MDVEVRSNYNLRDSGDNYQDMVKNRQQQQDTKAQNVSRTRTPSEEQDQNQNKSRGNNGQDRRGENLTGGGALDKQGQFHEGASKGGRASGRSRGGRNEDEDNYDEDEDQDYNRSGSKRNQSRGASNQGSNLMGGGAMDKQGNFHPGNREGKNQYTSGRGQRGGRDDYDEDEDYDDNRNQGKGRQGRRGGQGGGDQRGSNLSGGGAYDKSGQFHEGASKGGRASGRYRGGRDEDEDNYDEDEDQDYNRGGRNQSRGGDRRGQNLTGGGAMDKQGNFHSGNRQGKNQYTSSRDQRGGRDYDNEDYDDEEDYQDNRNQGRRSQGTGRQGYSGRPDNRQNNGQNLARGGAYDKSGQFHEGQSKGGRSRKYDRGDENEDTYDEDEDQDYSRGGRAERNQSRDGDNRGSNLMGGGAMDKQGNFHPGNREGKNQYRSGRGQRGGRDYDEDEDYDDNRNQGKDRQGRSGQGRRGGQGGGDQRGSNLSGGGAYDKSGQFHEGASKGGRASGRSRGGRDYDDEDEDYDDNRNQGKGRQGRGGQGRGQQGGGDQRGSNLSGGGAYDKSGQFHEGASKGGRVRKYDRGDEDTYGEDEDQDYNRSGRSGRNQSRGGDRRGQNLTGGGAMDKQGNFHSGNREGKNQYTSGRGQRGARGGDDDDEDYDDNRNQGKRKQGGRGGQGRGQKGGGDQRGSNLSGGGAYDKSGQFHEGVSKGGRARKGTRNRGNADDNDDNYDRVDRFDNVRVRPREIEDLLEDADNFLAEPIPSKPEDYFDDDSEFEYVYEPKLSRVLGRGSRNEEIDQAEMDQKKQSYFSRGRGSQRGQGGNAGSGTGTSGGKTNRGRRGSRFVDNTGYGEDDYEEYEPQMQKRQHVEGRAY